MFSIKNVEFDFTMGCMLVFFLCFEYWMWNLQIFDFWFFFPKFAKSACLFWPKITMIVIEISLKLEDAKYWWNNPNLHRLGLKSQQLHFVLFLATEKFIILTIVQIHDFFFHHKDNFFNCTYQCPIRINNSKFSKKYLNFPWMIEPKLFFLLFTWEKNILNKQYVSWGSKYSSFLDFFCKTKKMICLENICFWGTLWKMHLLQFHR